MLVCCAARGVHVQEALMRTPLLATVKVFLRWNGFHDPKQADRNLSRWLAQCPQVLICPPPLLGHHLMVTSLLDRSEVITCPMKDGNGERTFKLGLIVTHGSQMSKTAPTESPATTLSCPSYDLQENSAATNSRPKWHPISPLIPTMRLGRNSLNCDQP
ncbi:hypothetical protein O181_000310 [Austropuccinia psidii MF-1]|uniref:Uncharacterized protein n=1 Tax=Austropuccinia psidii MF-1 TaxID=1389203 RepID=A0A9Q3B8P5_9BASI|nr:hypothetical protein [Austropuccinia psidii MF-1]